MRIIQGKTKVAFKALGGKALAIYWHLGVRKALEERGFVFTQGRRDGAERPSGPWIINPLIGSSGGAFFAALTIAGLSVEDVMALFEDEPARWKIRPITKKDIFTRNPLEVRPYLRRVQATIQLRRQHGRSRGMRAGDFLAITSPFNTEGLERYLREEVLRDLDQFAELTTELYVMTTELDVPRAVVFGEKCTGQVHDYLYRCAPSVARTMAASMAIPPIFIPVPIPDEDGRTVFYVDGEIRNPYMTHVAEEAGADLIFVSSIYQAYRFTPEISSLYSYGLPWVWNQILAQSMDAKRTLAIRLRAQHREAILRSREFLAERLPPAELEAHVRLLEETLEYRPQVEVINLTPEFDRELFFADPFDLSPERMREVVGKGYRRAQEVLREYEFR